MRYAFHSEQWLPYSIERVFAFFANPKNLPRLMPSWQRTRIEEISIVPPPPPLTISDSARRLSTLIAGAGTRLTLSFRPFPLSPIRLRWQAEIDTFVWNQQFSDTQLRGPFAQWHHTHTLTSEDRTGDSGDAIAGTLLRDEVRYQLPFGRLGELAHPLIARQLSHTFEYRHRRTRELLAANFS